MQPGPPAPLLPSQVWWPLYARPPPGRLVSHHHLQVDLVTASFGPRTSFIHSFIHPLGAHCTDTVASVLCQEQGLGWAQAPTGREAGRACGQG